MERLFPNAQIYGADIDKNILKDEERIKTFYVDQTDQKLLMIYLKILELLILILSLKMDFMSLMRIFVFLKTQ